MTYKNKFVVNRKPVTVYLVIEEYMACNTIFSWLFLHKIKASIMTENNVLVSGLLGYQFKKQMIVPQ